MADTAVSSSNTSGNDDDVVSDSEYQSKTITPPDSPVPWSTNHPTSDLNLRVKPTISTDVVSACSHLFLNEEYADFKIIVDDQTFPAHRSVVCTQSEFFKLALRGGFKEAEEGIITISDESPKDIYRLLYYLYNNNYREYATSYYDDGLDEEDWGPDPLPAEHVHYGTRTNIAMYRLADKYGIAPLAKLATEKQYALLDDASMVSESCWAARQVYSAFDRKDDAMRAVVREHIIEGPLPEWSSLEGEEEEMRDIRLLMQTHGDFAWVLIERLYVIMEAEGKLRRKITDELARKRELYRDSLRRNKALEQQVKGLEATVRTLDGRVARLTVKAANAEAGVAPRTKRQRQG